MYSVLRITAINFISMFDTLAVLQRLPATGASRGRECSTRVSISLSRFEGRKQNIEIIIRPSSGTIDQCVSCV